MFSRFATIFLTLAFLITAASPTVVLAQPKMTHGCHEAPVEMPATCAIHCLDNAINEDEVEFNLTPGVELFVPAALEETVEPEIVVSSPPTFEDSAVFRDARVILTTIKRE